MPSTAGKRIGVNITKVHEIAQPTSDQLKPVITPSVSTLMLPPQTAKNRSQPMSHPQSESDISTDGAHSRPVDDIGQVSAASGATTPMGPVGGASRAALTSVAQPPPQPKKSYWSVQERANFAHLLALLGTDWQLMARAIGSKTATQARNFFKAHRERLNLDKALQEYETLKAQNKLPSPESIIASIQGGMSTPIVQDGEVINVELVKERRGRKRKPHTLVPPSPVLEPSPQEQPQTQQLQPQPQYKPQVAPPRTAGPALSSAAVQKEMSLDQAAQLAAMKAQKSRIIAAETAVFPVLPSMPRALRMPNIVTPTRGLDNKTQQQQQPILPSKPSLATKSTQSPTPESRPRPSGFRIDALLNDETPLPSPFKEAEHSQGERSETVEPTPPPLPHVRAKLEAEEEGG
ncbi:DNA-binding protein snt1, partial [Spiromyces aspiralis]